MHKLVLLAAFAVTASATLVSATELLVKVSADSNQQRVLQKINRAGLQAKPVRFSNWALVETNDVRSTQRLLQKTAGIEYVQPNYPIKFLENYATNDPQLRMRLKKQLAQHRDELMLDNPEIPEVPMLTTGTDRKSVV